MIIVRIIGWALVVIAIGAVGHEGFSWLQSGSYRTFAFGEMWAAIDRASLNLIQAGIQRHVSPLLWEQVVLRILLAPAWLVLAAPGAALVFSFRRYSYRRSSRRR